MKTFKLLGASALAMAFASPAWAQAAPQATPQAADEAAEDSGEIVVTAQRQNQTLQSVPIAVSAFNSEALEKQQIKNSSDLQLTLPNIVFTKTSFAGASFTIRGVGDLCTGVSCDAATGVHMNNSPIPSTRLFETEFFDLERIEVLRGPQGTLYGRNATSGVVNLISAKPDLSGTHASAEGEYGNYSSFKFKGMLNLPIGDTLAARVAGFYQKRDGYTLNLFNNSRVDDRNMYGVRASLRWEPTSDTTVDLMGYYFHEKDNRLRIQKQLCHRDPLGVLGCLPDSRPYEYPNANSQLGGTFPSRQTLRIAGGAGLGAAFAPLGLTDLYGADTNAGSVSPADPRQIRSSFTPQYYAVEKQAQATIKHDFGTVKVELQGMWSQTSVDSKLDSGQAVANRAVYQSGLNTLASYAANGIPGIPGSAAYFAPIAAALIPNGPTGALCTSIAEDTHTGAYGGYKICGANPVTYDRSSIDTETWSVEGLVSTKLDGPFNALIGATYLRNKATDSHYNVDQFALDYTSGVLGALQSLGRTLQGVATPPSYLGPTTFDSNTPEFTLKSYGIFGEAYFEASDKLKITAGLRYNNDKKALISRGQLFNYLIPFGTTVAENSPYFYGFNLAPGAAKLAPYDADPSTVCTTTPTATGVQTASTVSGCEAVAVGAASFNELTGRLVLDYKVGEHNLLYASFSRGYKSGGINPPLQAGLIAPKTFAPEFVNAFEIGSKNTFADGMFTLNASAFYYQYKGMQLSRIVNRTSINDNVDANIYGVELETIIRPAHGWVINMGGSYLKTKVSGDLFIQNPRDPAAGRSDAVIIKDIQAAFNCVVTPNVAGNAAGANTLVGAINGSLGLQAPKPFAADSGVAATGAFGSCAGIAGAIAAPSAGLSALLNGGAAGALPFTVTNVGLTQNIRGKQLPQAPTVKWNVGVQYTAEMSNGMHIVPRADIIFVGPSFGNIFNGPVNKIQGYSQINAQLQLNGVDDKWFVRGYVQNLTNGSPITGLGVGDQSQGVFTNIFTLEPRRYGIAAGIKF